MEILVTLLHLAVRTAKLSGPGGVRAVIAENLLLKQQLIVLRRARQRAPNLAMSDRLICGLGSLFLSPGRIRKVAIGVRPSTLLAFQQALVRRKYQRLFSSGQCPKKAGPKGPSEALIQAIVQAIVEFKSRNPRFGCPRIAHHLAHVRRRTRQERRLPRAVETRRWCTNPAALWSRDRDSLDSLRNDHTEGMQSRVHPTYKTKYRVANWASHDHALVHRGDITMWVSPEAIATWEPAGVGTRGGQRKYSDLAIGTALTLRLLFHLPLRQTEGFLIRFSA